jgi:hypothetical protein
MFFNLAKSLLLLKKALRHSSSLPIQFQHAMPQLLNTKLASDEKGPSFFKSPNSIPTRDVMTIHTDFSFLQR